ncbi:hypothetical protein PZA11_003092 [Diplocarpon coronariae]|uniref:Alb1-domain-containing protein n=1 Tax=Diplocarpon coronariae TaxID=2795749 RepID=A0A218Z0X8_9HELO|nr:hypothetical protein JHW43_009200 [Diplocarpon mali]OWP01354.1 hypothetical protein B2J93_2764 [Marssonina coronariae]
MAKTAPPKKKGVTSIHSRAAKRASSPSIDLDKSLKDLKPPQATKTKQPSILAIHQGAGISRKSKNGRKAVLSAKAKKRQEKVMDRAEAVINKKEIKIEKSKDRARIVQDRAKNWEDLNKKMLEQKAREKAAALEKERETEREKDREGWEDDEEMEEAVQVEEAPTAVLKVAKNFQAADSTPLLSEAEDEIL